MKSAKYYVMYGIAAIVAALVIWPLMGWLSSKVIGSQFEYTANEYILRPVIFGIALALINYFFDSRKQK